MTLFRILGAILSLLILSDRAFAYNLGTHARITLNALQLSQSTSAFVRNGLGFADGIAHDLKAIYFDMNGGSATPAQARRETTFELVFMPDNLETDGTDIDPDAPHYIEGWLMQGAIREDDGRYLPIINGSQPQDDPAGSINRFCNHFFDPKNNAKLNFPLCVDDLTSAPIWGLGVKELGGDSQPGSITSPMSMSSPNPARRNHYTIIDAREAMWRALTLKQYKDSDGNLVTANGSLVDLPLPNDLAKGGPSFPSDPTAAKEQYRNAYLATVFRTLGDVVHLLEDMAQPQHTRDEIHPLGEATDYETYIEDRAIDPNSPHYIAAFNPLTVSTEALQPLSYAPPSIPTFTSYSDYWSTAPGGDLTGGRGIADYSNRGFFTFGHNLGQGKYSLPSNNVADYAQVIAPDRQGVLWDYLDGTVLDPLLGDSPVVHRTKLSAVIVAARDAGLNPSNVMYTLDQEIFDADADLLIPRAVAYSTGLLDYFFRGQMQIALPDTGFYAIVDHSTFASGGSNFPTDVLHGFKGFGKIKLKLKNITASITPPNGAGQTQDMTAGTLVAVIKFRRNTCYDDSLSNWPANKSDVLERGCRATVEEIVVSDPIPNTSVPSSAQSPDGADVTFNFSEQQLPINAWDVVLQVVYRGQLGSEPDAVVVATKDISEPTFAALMNYTDYVLLNGMFYLPSDLQSLHQDLFSQVSSACRVFVSDHYEVGSNCYNISDDFTFAFGTSPVTLSASGAGAVPARHLARFAFLTDLGSSISLSWQLGAVNCWIFLGDPVLFKPYVAQGTVDGDFNYSDPKNLRGVWVWGGNVCYSDIGITLTDPTAIDFWQMTNNLNSFETAPVPLTIDGW